MKRLPYRNTTYQRIRAATCRKGQSLHTVHLVDWDIDTTLSSYRIRQFIRSSSQSDLHAIEPLLNELRHFRLAVRKIVVRSEPIGTDLYERTIELDTYLIASDRGEECLSDYGTIIKDRIREDTDTGGIWTETLTPIEKLYMASAYIQSMRDDPSKKSDDPFNLGRLG